MRHMSSCRHVVRPPLGIPPYSIWVLCPSPDFHKKNHLCCETHLWIWLQTKKLKDLQLPISWTCVSTGRHCDYIAHDTLDILYAHFNVIVISHRDDANWPTTPSNFTPLDFFLWNLHTSQLNANKPQIIVILKANRIHSNRLNSDWFMCESRDIWTFYIKFHT